MLTNSIDLKRSPPVWLHISLRDAFYVISYSRREEITMCKTPPLCWRYAWVDLKLRFHIFHKWIIINHICMEGHTKQLLGNARISSILIVAKESHESSTLSVYPCSQCIDMRRSTSCFILFYCEPQQEKSKKWNLCSTLQATIEDKYKIAHWRKAKQMQLVWLFVLW